MAHCDTCKANKVCDHNRFGFENCGNYIPSDVVEVVRCKDCKYNDELTISEKFYYKKGCVACTRVRSFVRLAEDFCSDGKRMEQG